jgi:hypothetical protein
MKVDIELDTSWYSYNLMKSQLVSSRQFELDYFPNIQKMNKVKGFNPTASRLIRKIINNLSAYQQAKLRVLTEKSSELFRSKPRIISGLFDNVKFLPNEETLKYYLTFPENKSDWYLKNEQYDNGSFKVAVHVRRTDYLNLGHIYNVVDKTYYLEAEKIVRKSNQKVVFHLFSDDPQGAVEWLEDSINFEKIISQPSNSPSGELLRLMSTYDCIIAANSTFSWWAAYIGRLNQNMKSIILPKKFSNLISDLPQEHLHIQGCIFI